MFFLFLLGFGFEELPERTLSLQRQENTHYPTIAAMKGSLDHVSIRMKPEVDWLKALLNNERK